MVKANDSWLYHQHSAWQPPNLNYMGAPLQPRQEEGLPACMNPHASMFSANIALPRLATSGLPGLTIGQTNQVNGLFQCLPSHFQTLLPTPNPSLKGKQSAFPDRLCGKATPNSISGSMQKRFLIFDQSQNETRLIFSSVYPSAQHPTFLPTKPVCANDLHQEEHAAEVDQVYLTKPILHDESDENHINGEGSEMHEDTEEINALLYSDADDDDDYYGEDDEEISTGHSPIAIKGSYEEQDLVEVITEEVASSDGPTKRQKLLDGGYNKSSLLDTASSVKPNASCKFEDVAESNCAQGRIKGDEKGSISSNKWSRKDRILETLKILESIVPGANGKDPLLVLDEAISYLKSLRLKAKTLGVDYH
ncbi:hypothetical protein L1049_000013 [Liquidambar formosana]|uniref:BHLH domain-containing protein n=1 Tax=Liquidambar formosana TaxID=63359 RepID=A0AAP0N6G2_LIQFO